MIKITFNELKELHGRSIPFLKPDEEPTEPEQGIIEINGANIFNCFSHKVKCDNDTFGFVHFYDRQKNRVASVSLFNVNGECLIVEEFGKITSQTTLRVMSERGMIQSL